MDEFLTGTEAPGWSTPPKAKLPEEALAMLKALAPEWSQQQYRPPDIDYANTPPSKIGPGESNPLPEAMLDAATMLPSAGAKAIGPAALKAIFAGPMARTADLDALRSALRAADRMIAPYPKLSAASKHEIINYEMLRHGGWHLGPEGKPMFEISDANSRLIDSGIESLRKGNDVKLSNVIEHPDLYKAYPNRFEHINVLPENDPKQSGSWQFWHRNSMKLNPNMDRSFTHGLVGHEVQHATDELEKRALGANWPERQEIGRYVVREKTGLPQGAPLDPALEKRAVAAGYKSYLEDVGETRAGNVENRMLMTPEERIRMQPWRTERYKPQNQTVPANWLNEQDQTTQNYMRALLKAYHRD